MERSILKGNAKEQLRGKWPLAIGVTFVFGLLTQMWNYTHSYQSAAGETGISVTVWVLGIVALLIGGPLSVGFSKFILKINRGEDASFGDLFSAFDIYVKSTLLFIAVSGIILIGFVLFIIPGVIAALMFSQVFFILSEDNSKSVGDCLKESMDIMNGYKGEYFILQLSFIGWALLALLPCGLGFLVLEPYINVTCGNFYLEITKNKIA